MEEVDVAAPQTFTGPSQGMVKAAARPAGEGGEELAGKDHWVVPGAVGTFLETEIGKHGEFRELNKREEVEGKNHQRLQ